MKKKSITAPFELMIAIVERGNAKRVYDILEQNDAVFSLVTLGEGTAKSATADIFGFGVVDREIVWSLIEPIKSDRIIGSINAALQLEEPGKGIVMTIPSSSASSIMLDFLGINY